MRNLFASLLLCALVLSPTRVSAQVTLGTPLLCSDPIVHDMAYRAVAARYAANRLPAPRSLQREFTTLYEDTSARARSARAAMADFPPEHVRICTTDSDGTLGTFVFTSTTRLVAVMVTNYGIPGDMTQLEEQH